jgi:hypothetical protein
MTVMMRAYFLIYSILIPPFSLFLTLTPLNFVMSVCLFVCKKSKKDGRHSDGIGNQNVVLKSIDTLQFWLNGDKYTPMSICAILKCNSPNTHRTNKKCSFCRALGHGICHKTDRRMQAFYAIKRPWPVTR